MSFCIWYTQKKALYMKNEQIMKSVMRFYGPSFERVSTVFGKVLYAFRHNPFYSKKVIHIETKSEEDIKTITFQFNGREDRKYELVFDILPEENIDEYKKKKNVTYIDDVNIGYNVIMWNFDTLYKGFIKEHLFEVFSRRLILKGNALLHEYRGKTSLYAPIERLIDIKRANPIDEGDGIDYLCKYVVIENNQGYLVEFTIQIKSSALYQGKHVKKYPSISSLVLMDTESEKSFHLFEKAINFVAKQKRDGFTYHVDISKGEFFHFKS